MEHADARQWRGAKALKHLSLFPTKITFPAVCDHTTWKISSSNPSKCVHPKVRPAHLQSFYGNLHTSVPSPPRLLTSAWLPAFSGYQGSTAALLQLPALPPDAGAGTFTRMASKPGESRWQWKHKYLAGAVYLTLPSGEVRCHGGSFEDQRWICERLAPYTSEWNQPLRVTKVCGGTASRHGNLISHSYQSAHEFRSFLLS